MSAAPARAATEWPGVVWNTPVLRGIDAHARAAIEEAGRLAPAPVGAALYRDGDASDSFFVVVRGEVELRAVRRGDDAATLVRTARAGDALGEEALLPGLPRRATAIVVAAATIAEIPVAVFRRITGRAAGATRRPPGDPAVRDGSQLGGADLLPGSAFEREQRYIERAAARDLLACSAFARELSGADLEMLLDAARLERVARGTRIFEPGAPAEHLYFVVEGLVQLQREDDAARPTIAAYVARGDFFGDQEALAGIPRRGAAVAAGDTWCAAVPRAVLRTLADRNPGVLARLRRVAEAQEASHAEVISAAEARSTRHVFRDLYRMQIARSLLVIDQDSCVRCGHCAWSCASVHGTSRLVRRGDKVVTELAGSGAATLLLPNTCQHCRHAACMIDCPTGAIGRDPEGEVFIRPELCTGCGNCAKACPWDNIQLAPRPAPLVQLGRRPAAAAVPAPDVRSRLDLSPDVGRPAVAVGAPAPDVRSLLGLSPEIAVKCDLCRGYEAPACVEACPTGAVLRIDPSRDVAEVAGILGTAVAERSPRRARTGLGAAAAWSALSAIAIAGAVLVGVLTRAWSPDRGIGLAAGGVAAAMIAALAAYVVPKRRIRGRMVRRRPRADAPALARSRTRGHLLAHLVVGALLPAAAIAHTGTRFTASPGGAAAAALVVAIALGALAAFAYRAIPRALTRLERAGSLPEDLDDQRAQLEARLFRAVSGTSDRVKALVERILLPYARSRAGSIALALSSRALPGERARLRALIDARLEGRTIAGTDDLVEVAVELRAWPARRFLERMLRVWPPLHAIAAAAVIALVALHVVVVVAR